MLSDPQPTVLTLPANYLLNLSKCSTMSCRYHQLLDQICEQKKPLWPQTCNLPLPKTYERIKNQLIYTSCQVVSKGDHLITQLDFRQKSSPNKFFQTTFHHHFQAKNDIFGLRFHFEGKNNQSEFQCHNCGFKFQRLHFLHAKNVVFND